VRYVSQLKKKFILVGALKALGLQISGRDGVLKMLRGSIVVMKSVRRNNLDYLKSTTVAGQVATSIGSDDNYTRLWHMKFEHTDEKSL